MTNLDARINNFESQFSMAGFLPYINAEGSGKSNIFEWCKSTAKDYFNEDSDHYFMAVAILQSHIGIKQASPNPCVGAVYTKHGKILSQGVTQPFGGMHAERYTAEVLTDEQLEGSTLFVTLEPCAHTGKQPPCLDFIIEKRISRVVISCIDPDKRMSGDSVKMLKKNNIDVEIGLLSSATKSLLRAFFTYKKTGKTVFIGKWAQTIDGTLADHLGSSKWISGSLSRRYSHWLRIKYDAIMIGANTAVHDTPSLTIRENFIFNGSVQNPLRIVVDPKAKIFDNPNFEKIFKTLLGQDKRLIILTNKKSSRLSQGALKNLETNKTHVLQCLEPSNLVESIQNAMYDKTVTKFNGHKEILSCLVEGGPRLLTAFIEKNALSFFHVFVAPFFMGGPNKIAQEGSSFPLPIENTKRLELNYSTIIDQDILCEYTLNTKEQARNEAFSDTNLE